MANNLTYPGVYIEEISSGVHTVVGVQTSITAFVGPTRYGPIDEPGVCFSFADFERKYGGLSLDSPLSFAVRDFFVNEGSKAIICRIYKKAGGSGKSVIDVGGKLKLEAVDPGTWGDDLKVSVVRQAGSESYDLVVAIVRDEKVESMAVHRGVSSDVKKKRRIDRILDAESDMVRVFGGELAEGASPPDATTDPDRNTSFYDPTKAGKSYFSGSGGADSDKLGTTDFIAGNNEADKTGLYLLEHADLFNILCIPPLALEDTLDPAIVTEAATYCRRRRAMLLIDPPAEWNTVDKARAGMAAFSNLSENAAVYFPRLKQSNLLRGGRMETFVPCGAVAGVMARTDAERGVWKAPAGSEAELVGVPELAVKLGDMENGELNPIGVNCLRSFADRGRVVWGARTTKGNDSLASEWKYVPIRRLALFLEETLFRSTSWVVFEPNDEPLWAQVRLNIGSFMHGMFVKGAFQGSSPKEAYFVKCDADTTPQADRDAGIVNIRVGFAPLKPAEFVVISFQQIAGQIAV